MPLLVGETPSQPGHFPILCEQRHMELTKSQSGEDSWCHHICKCPFFLPGEPGSLPAKPGDWDHIIWASCSGESPPRSMALQSAKEHVSNRATVREVDESTGVQRGERSWGWHRSQGPSHLFIPIGGSLRQKPVLGKLLFAAIPLCQEEYLGSL